MLKQRTASEARWLFDLLHELWHAGEKPSLRERTIVESAESELDRFKDEEEQKASRFAGDAVLDGRAEELVSMVMEETDGNIPRFKAAVPRIARRESVSPDSLAKLPSISTVPCRARTGGELPTTFNKLAILGGSRGTRS